MVEKKDLRREEKIVWCASKGVACGYHTFINQLEKALVNYMNEEGLSKEEVNAIGGIGCSSRAVLYQDLCTYHTTHGNATSFAQGLELALRMKNKKDLVYVVGGDGDQLAIGLANFMNVCRNNQDITTFILNNEIYGMTSGQTSPTTPQGTKTNSAPHGVIEQPLDPIELAISAGATYVARASAFKKDTQKLEELIYKSFKHKGTSIIVVDSPCPTQNPTHKKNNIKDLSETYFKNYIDINKIREYKPSEVIKKVLTAQPYTALAENGDIVISPYMHYTLSNTKTKYARLKEFIKKHNLNLTITGLIHEEKNKKTLSQLIKEQKQKTLSNYPKNSKLSERAKKLLEKHKI